jgi:hypothetical protein
MSKLPGAQFEILVDGAVTDGEITISKPLRTSATR